MTTTVYLIRHAEAEGNVYRRCHGQYDSLLTVNGEAQLPYLAERFAKESLQAVYASDLYRARKTAEAIAAPHGLTVQVRPVLREICMGEWEDKSWAELLRTYPEAYTRWQICPWEAAAPGGETILQSGKRMLDGVRQLVEENEGSTFAVVAHGSVIRGALSILLDLHPEQLNTLEWGDNTCVSKIAFTDANHAKVEYRNDVQHLPMEMQTFQSIGWKDVKGIPTLIQLWFRSVDLHNAEDCETLLRFAEQKYRQAYGNVQGLDAEQYLTETAKMLQEDPDAVTFGMLENQPVALVRLNVCDQSRPDVGKVGSFVIDTPYRGMGISSQMLGQAISVYRARGKKQLCADVAEKNERAQGFYKKYGFIKADEVHNENGVHFCMMKPIHVAPYEADAM